MASGAGQRVVSQPLGHNTNVLNRGPDAALLKPSIKTSVTGRSRRGNYFSLWKYFRSETDYKGPGGRVPRGAGLPAE